MEHKQRSPRRSLYTVLGVEASATADEIKSAYRKAAMRWHPDRNPGNTSVAEARFKELGNAYAVLSDENRRAAYDESLQASTAPEPDADEDANAIFLKAMFELALVMSLNGYNRDVLLGALLSKGCPESIAIQIATEIVARRAAAQNTSSAKKAREPREPKPRQNSTPASAVPVAESSWSRWSAGLALVAFVVVLVVVTNNSPRSTLTQLIATPAASTAPVARSFSPSLAVAAINANIRSKPSAKAKILTQVARGTLLERIDSTSGFVKVRLSDRGEGWIADELTISSSEVARLSAVTATEYTKSRMPDRSLELLLEQLKPYRILLATALFQVANESVNIDRTLDEIAETVQVSVPSDVAAGIWFSLEARSLSDNGMFSESLDAARAAVFADPAKADYHVAFGYAAVKAGRYDFAGAVVPFLPLLAPNSTNTWVLAGISAAVESQTMTSGALALAFRKSANPKVTARVLAGLAASSKEVRVSDAIAQAVDRWNSDGRTQDSAAE